jgi:diguanylate cyclase (GGDEF)-like protein
MALLDQALELQDDSAGEPLWRLVQPLVDDPAAPLAQRLQATLLSGTALERMGRATDAARAAQQVLNQTADKPDSIWRAHAHLQVARLAHAVGDNDYALACIEQAWPVVQNSTDGRLGFFARNMLGVVQNALKHHAESIEWHLQAAAVAAAADLPKLAAMGRLNAAGRWSDLGVEAAAAGRTDEARRHREHCVTLLDASLEEVRAVGMDRLRPVALANRGAALAHLGRNSEAEADFAQVLALAPGDFALRAFVAMQEITSLIQSRDWAAAAALSAVAIAAAEPHANANRHRQTLYEQASEIHEALGDPAAALAWHRRFHALYKQIALESAESRSRLLAVRLGTEQALADAAAERSKSLALERRAEALHQEATRDALTGLANRRHLDRELLAVHAAARATGRALYVAMLDADHFKCINDQYSHAVGDAVLRTLGALLLELVRGKDLPARYGGEEFVLVFDGIPPSRVHPVCERIRLTVEQYDWTRLAPGLAVTISIGVADIAGCESPAAGMTAVDALLYAAKRAGRNRVVSVPAAG